MIKKIASTIRIKTASFNWIVEVSNKNSYFTNFDQVRRHVLKLCPTQAEKEKVLLTLTSMLEDLGIKTIEDLSAWYLTRVKKHPEFLKNISL